MRSLDGVPVTLNDALEPGQVLVFDEPSHKACVMHTFTYIQFTSRTHAEALAKIVTVLTLRAYRKFTEAENRL